MDEIESESNYPQMDEDDRDWVSTFVSNEGSKSIPPDAIIEGFISIISWFDSDGEKQWRHYNTIDAPLSHIIGLLEMTKHTLMTNNEKDID